MYVLWVSPWQPVVVVVRHFPASRNMSESMNSSLYHKMLVVTYGTVQQSACLTSTGTLEGGTGVY